VPRRELGQSSTTLPFIPASCEFSVFRVAERTYESAPA
jgi:hypothetical protein